MTNEQRSNFVKSFKLEVYDYRKEIDPHNELDWLSLTIGWAIAKEIKIEEALEFATYIRYNTELG